MAEREEKGSQPYDYGIVDPFKVGNQAGARSTAGNIEQYGYQVLPESYGESVAVIDIGPFHLAAVLEGIGTKNVVADIVDEDLDSSHYDAIAWCDMATRVNDLITRGARPMIYLDFIATGEDKWFKNQPRAKAYAVGYTAVCNELGIAWVGGESQVLSGVIIPGRAVLAGALIGDINPKSRYVDGEGLQAGDDIIFVESSGVHANGISGLRELAADKLQLPDGYNTKLSDGTSFGEAILRPTYLYSNLVQSLLDEEIDIHRMENVTGHGFSKLMRARQPFTYNIEELPPEMPIYEFIKEQTGADDKKMFGSYNMGAGYAIFAPEKEADRIIAIAAQQELRAWVAGTVEDGPRQVIIKQKGITFDKLDIR